MKLPAKPALLLAMNILMPDPAVAQQPPTGADTVVLTLRTAQEIGVRRSPVLGAAAQAGPLAQGELRQAREFQNPDFDLEAPGGSNGILGAYQATLGQTIEWAGQRGLRVGAAEHGVTRARGEVRNAARELVRDVSLAYVEAAAAAERLDLAQRVFDLNQRLLTAVRSQLSEGKISPLDANLAEIESGRARAHVLAARREFASATATLKREIGIEPDRPVRVTLPEDSVVPAPAPEDSLVALALRQRPDLVSSEAAVAQASSELGLARREAIPSLTIGPYAERNEATGSPQVGIAVGMPLPLWNRNGGAVTQRSADLARARYERSATDLAVRSEVREARQALVAAREEVETFRQSVLAPVRENQRLLEIAYQAGKIDLPTLLLVRNQLLGAETEYWDAWLAREQARLRLDAATASFDVGQMASREEDR